MDRVRLRTARPDGFATPPVRNRLSAAAPATLPHRTTWPRLPATRSSPPATPRVRCRSRSGRARESATTPPRRWAPRRAPGEPRTALSRHDVARPAVELEAAHFLPHHGACRLPNVALGRANRNRAQRLGLRNLRQDFLGSRIRRTCCNQSVRSTASCRPRLAAPTSLPSFAWRGRALFRSRAICRGC